MGLSCWFNLCNLCRLFFLKMLKRCSVSINAMLYFYTSAIRPILEYACPAWYTSLTKDQSRQIEHIQKRALGIIFNSNCIDYKIFCQVHHTTPLTDRRHELCKVFLTTCCKRIVAYIIYFHHHAKIFVTNCDIQLNLSLQLPSLYASKTV